MRVVHAADIAHDDVFLVDLLGQLITAWSQRCPIASSTCTCSTRWLPPFKSSPSLMRCARLAFTCASEVGNVGNPKRPYKQITMTMTMRINFHLIWEFMRAA